MRFLLWPLIAYARWRCDMCRMYGRGACFLHGDRNSGEEASYRVYKPNTTGDRDA